MKINFYSQRTRNIRSKLLSILSKQPKIFENKLKPKKTPNRKHRKSVFLSNKIHSKYQRTIIVKKNQITINRQGMWHLLLSKLAYQRHFMVILVGKIFGMNLLEELWECVKVLFVGCCRINFRQINCSLFEHTLSQKLVRFRI